MSVAVILAAVAFLPIALALRARRANERRRIACRLRMLERRIEDLEERRRQRAKTIRFAEMYGGSSHVWYPGGAPR